MLCAKCSNKNEFLELTMGEFAILNKINTYTLSYHLNYSCKSCFKAGFIQAINKFKIEVENYNLNLLSI